MNTTTQRPRPWAAAPAFFLPFLLAACAGGGSVNAPDTLPGAQLRTQPQLAVGSAIADFANEGTITKIGTPTPWQMSEGSSGSLNHYRPGSIEWRYWREVSWNPARSGYVTEPLYQNVYAYTTPEGKTYHFTALANPQSNTGHAVTQTQNPTKHLMQPLADNGGKIIACCENGSAGFPPGYLSHSRFGAWLSPAGEVRFFNGGVLADPAAMLGAAQNGGTPTGKATYEVLGIRVRDGAAVTSSHDTASRSNSLLTVNFNTGRLGGTILGNADFGGDIRFENVRVNGNAFGGTAVSENVSGQVVGNFFGTAGYRNPAGSEIGGQVRFGNAALDAVFGGSAIKQDANDTSTDLTPLPQ